MGVVHVSHLTQMIRLSDPTIRVGLPATVVCTGIGFRAMLEVGIEVFLKLKKAVF